MKLGLLIIMSFSYFVRHCCYARGCLNVWAVYRVAAIACFVDRKMKTTKSNVTFSLNFVLTIPESKTHPFSLNYDTTKFDKSIRFGRNS